MECRQNNQRIESKDLPVDQLTGASPLSLVTW